MHDVLEKYFRKESAAGFLLIGVTLFALILQNSPLSQFYDAFLHTPVEIRFGQLQIDKPLILWVNDGLMAIFFFLIGLEVKRELLEGHLSTVKQMALPGIAAIGGMAVPALVFVLFNFGDDFAMRGWAIPTATDIAFALGILSLIGNKVPISLKLFLLALAIIDDLGAIIVIALFYTSDLSWISIMIASFALITLFIMNRLNVIKKAAFILVGIVLWVSVLKSGVHATLAGVALAFMIPLHSKDKDGNSFSMSNQLENDLHGWVTFMILPLFAFVNAGVDLRGISMDQLLSSVPVGIFCGLFFGKQIGVFGFSWLAIKLKLAKLPEGSSWQELYGVSLLTGIGFTMSLFVNSLAYSDSSIYFYTDKLSILFASFVSGLLGYLVLKFSKPVKKEMQATS